jgi:hypothetical protein
MEDTLIYESTDEQEDKENKEDIKRLVQDTAKIKEIMKDINELIEDEGEQIIYAELITDDTEYILEETNIQLHKARESQKKAAILKGTLVSAGIGACIGGPIGGVLGSSIHLTVLGVLVGGVSIGGFAGSLINYILSFK